MDPDWLLRIFQYCNSEHSLRSRLYWGGTKPYENNSPGWVYSAGVQPLQQHQARSRHWTWRPAV